MSIRENVDEPEEITSQSIAVPGVSCAFESDLIETGRIYTRFDEVTNVSCIDGYEGGGEWLCLMNGNYSGVPCTRITCEGNIPYKLGDDDIVILSGESLEVTCDEGYGDSSTWSCSLDGELTGNPCRKKCEAPVENLLDGDFFYAYAGDSNLELTCKEGYYSESSYRCNDNGEFDNVPTCTPVTCPAIGLVPNSKTSVGAGVYDGDSVNVSCHRSFDKNGLEVQWSCGSNGQWQGPACEYPHDCILAVDNLAGGFESLRANRNQVLPVSCDFEYVPSSSSVICTEVSPGVFGFDNIPTCARDNNTCELTVENSRAENGIYYIPPNKSVLVTCLDGFYGGGKVDCFAEGAEEGAEEDAAYAPSSSPTCVSYDISSPSTIGYTESYAGAASEVNCGDDTIIFPDHSFVFKIELDAEKKLKLPTEITAETDFYVDWGDSDCDHLTSSSEESDLVHEYVREEDAEGVERTIKIIGSVVNWGNSSNDFYKDIITHVINLGDVNWKDLSNAFRDTRKLESFRAKHTNTSNVTDMSNMFYYSFDIDSIIESLDLSTFDTSNVSTMKGMFNRASTLVNVDISNFNTLKVSDMSQMFQYTNDLISLDLSSFDTRNVKDMSRMFYSAKSLTTLDLSNFNTEKVENMSSMFGFCQNLTHLDLTNFDTKNVTNMWMMFYFTKKLATLDISSFDTSNVTNFGYLFSNNDGLSHIDLSKFDTSSATNMSQMFQSMDKLSSLDLSNFNTINVTNMSDMFSYTTSLTHLDISGFNTGKVLNMNSMFNGASKLKELNLSNFNTKYTADMKAMFRNNPNIEKINFGKWIESSSILVQSDEANESLNNFSGTGWDPGSLPIIYCDGAPPSRLTALIDGFTCLPPPMIVTFTTTSANEVVTLGIGGGTISVDWGDGDEDSATTHSYEYAGTYEVWIEGANTITTVDNNWSNNLVKVNALGDLSSVTTFTNPFKDKTNLKLFSGFGKFRTLEEDDLGVNLSSWFEGTTSLEYVDFSKIDTSNVSNTSNMFKNATSLTHVNLGDFNHSVGTTTDMFSGTEIVAENSKKILHCSKEYDENETNLNWNTTIGGVSYKCENNLMPIVLEIGNPETCSGFEFSLNVTSWYSTIVDWGVGDDLTYDINSNTYTNEQVSEFVDCKTTVKVWGEYVTNGGLFNADSRDKIVSVKSFGHNVYIDPKSAFRNTSIVSAGGYGRFSIVSFDGLFMDANNLETVDLSNFDTSNVTNMGYMFYNSDNIQDLDLSNLNTSKVTRMRSMFRYMDKLEQLNLSGFDTSNVTDMSYMFGEIPELKVLDLSHFDTSKVTDMRSMFRFMDKLEQLNLSGFDTSNVTDMSYMFGDIPELKVLDLSHFDTSKVTDMIHMFRYSEFNSLNLGFWETDSVISSTSFMIFSDFLDSPAEGPFTEENSNLFCSNNDIDDSLSTGNEIFIDNKVYSCDGVSE